MKKAYPVHSESLRRKRNRKGFTLRVAKGFYHPVAVLILAAITLSIAIIFYLNSSVLFKPPKSDQASTPTPSLVPAEKGTADPDPIGASWKTYTKNFFSIKYPPTYKLSEYLAGSTLDISFSSSDEAINKNNLLTEGGRIRILIKEADQNSLDTAFDYFLHDASIQSKDAVTLAGKPALSGFAAIGDGISDKFKYLVVVNGNKRYLIQAWVTEDSRTNIYPIFDQILSTFKFLE